MASPARPRLRLEALQRGLHRLADGFHVGELRRGVVAGVAAGGREAAEQRPAQRIDHDVRGPDVAMHDPSLVQVADRLGHLLGDPAEFLEPRRLPRRQRLPAGVARQQSQPALVLDQRHEADDPRMVEVRQERGLVPQRLGRPALLDGHQLPTVQLGAKCHEP